MVKGESADIGKKECKEENEKRPVIKGNRE